MRDARICTYVPYVLRPTQLHIELSLVTTTYLVEYYSIYSISVRREDNAVQFVRASVR